MKAFFCDHCQQPIYFENVRCVHCGRTLGYLPDHHVMSALEPATEGSWHALFRPAKRKLYRQCANGKEYENCNWLVPVQDPNAFCASCRTNAIIPALEIEGNRQRWQKLEQAKRRVIDAVLRMGLSVEGDPRSNRPPLRLNFLGPTAGTPAPLTGYSQGVITVNIAEADDDEREKRRVRLREPYRTLVGHFRHEIAHYFWDQFIANSPRLDGFREWFGDETMDYGGALRLYYDNGPAPDWPVRFVTAYASSHPWEDWAESWAHYFHIADTIETAAAFRIGVRRVKAPSPDASFDEWLQTWPTLTCALNEINRGMGLPDLYPFALPAPAIEKLRYIHQLIRETGTPLKPFSGRSRRKESVKSAGDAHPPAAPPPMQ